MPHKDTSIAIKQAITQALNATQGHKHSYQQAITLALNATQGHKRSYLQAITLALNDTQGHKRSYQQAITSASAELLLLFETEVDPNAEY